MNKIVQPIKNYADWKKRTKGGSMSRDFQDLDKTVVDFFNLQQIAGLSASGNLAKAAKDVNTELKAWKRSKKSVRSFWRDSARNSKAKGYPIEGLVETLSNHIALPKINKCYCPAPSNKIAATEPIIDTLNTIGPLLKEGGEEGSVVYGGTSELEDLHPDARLYLVAHGHDHLPLFVITENGGEKRVWDPKEMAKALYLDGLRRNHGPLEMLVCSAGLSIASATLAKERINIRAKWMKNKSKYKEKYKSALLKPIDLDQATDFFKVSEITDRHLPLVALLIAELKKLDYHRLTVTAYKAKVDPRIKERKKENQPPRYGVKIIELWEKDEREGKKNVFKISDPRDAVVLTRAPSTKVELEKEQEWAEAHGLVGVTVEDASGSDMVKWSI